MSDSMLFGSLFTFYFLFLLHILAIELTILLQEYCWDTSRTYWLSFIVT